jgi:hypothetical protein
MRMPKPTVGVRKQNGSTLSLLNGTTHNDVLNHYDSIHKRQPPHLELESMPITVLPYRIRAALLHATLPPHLNWRTCTTKSPAMLRAR